MAASKRLAMTALTLLKTSRASSSPLLAYSRAKLPLFYNVDFSTVALSRHLCSSSSARDKISTSVDRSQFTKMEWEGIHYLISDTQHQQSTAVGGTEDLLNFLMREKHGLARRIFSRAGLDNTLILEAIRDFTSKKQQKVSRDGFAFSVGEDLNSLLENAVKLRKDMKDEFVSVEHFILAFYFDRRFGQQLFTNFGVSEKDLRDAIDAVRGSLKRELNEHWGIEKELMNRIQSLKEEIESSERAESLISLGRQLEEAERHLAEIVSRWTGRGFERLLYFTGWGGIVGQNMAVMSVADAIRRSRAGGGLSPHPNRPIASFMFTGPSGVGKKTLVNNLARFLFMTDETRPRSYLYNVTVRTDMSGYSGKDAVSRLVVALGHRKKERVLVQLTEYVRQRPYCVILFEEIEKAHHDVLSVLSQILDNGRIADGQGKTVCFKNTVIIMTSKIGSHLIPDTLSSNTYDITKKRVVDLARETFRPEFMNCIDEWILFKPYDAREIRNLAEDYIRKWKEYFENEKMELHYTEEAMDVLGRLVFDSRHVEMVVKQHVVDQMENLWDERDLHYLDGKKIKVDVNSDLCLGLVRAKLLPTHYQIYLGTYQTPANSRPNKLPLSDNSTPLCLRLCS